MASKLSITREKTAELVKEFGKSATDSGSAEVQVAILSERIRNLTEHIKDRDINEYRELIKKLGIRDNI